MPEGALTFWGIVAAIAIGSALKLFGGQRWDDWLDERWGRGSIRDWWLLRNSDHNRDRDPSR